MNDIWFELTNTLRNHFFELINIKENLTLVIFYKKQDKGCPNIHRLQIVQ